MNVHLIRLCVIVLGGIILLPSNLRAQCALAGIDTLAYETFESGLPEGWQVPRTSDGGRWQINAGKIGYYSNPGQDRWLYVDDEAANNVGVATVETPRYDLSQFQGDITVQVDLLFQEYAHTGRMRVELWADDQWHFLFADSVDFSGTLRMDLSAYVGEEIALRFTYDDEGGWGWGMGLDNLLLTGRMGICGNGICDPGESPALCPEDCPYQTKSHSGWIDMDQDLAGQTVTYQHFKGGTRCDDCSEEIPLPFDFAFLGESYDSVWINANGNLSFVDPYKPYTPEPFCLNGPKLLAPFYADADLNSGGEIRYYVDPAGHYLIVSWLKVGRYGCGSDCALTNTFQAILTDGSIEQVGPLRLPSGTNVVFNYGDMQWTTGNSSGGVDGFGGSAATVGINAGDGELCDGYGRYDQAGYDHLPGSAGTDCPAGGVSHLDYLSLLYHADLGLQVAPESTEPPASSPLELQGEAHPEGNLLMWRLPYPDQTTHFRLQRSTDGQGYQYLAGVELTDPSDGEEQAYRFIDDAPFPGVTFYRIQQIAENGDVVDQDTTQVMRQVRAGAEFGPFLRNLRLAPNPMQTQANVLYHLAEPGRVKFRLTDLAGRPLKQGQHQGQPGENAFPFSAPGLPSGLYVFSLEYRGEIKSLQLVKK